jgi:hypothetical protein
MYGRLVIPTGNNGKLGTLYGTIGETLHMVLVISAEATVLHSKSLDCVPKRLLQLSTILTTFLKYNIINMINLNIVPGIDRYGKEVMSGWCYSGYNLVKDINDLSPTKVIDVGCGNNLFKGLINNLYGFDKDNYPTVDKKTSIEDIDIELESVDVALCLGSLQYTSSDDQEHKLNKVLSWVKPGGYIIMRNWPFIDYIGHNEKYLNSSDFRIYYADFYKRTQQFNLSIHIPIKLDINSNFPQLERLVWWWRKN